MPSRKIRHPKKNKKVEPRTSLKEKFTEALELPKEIVMNVPKLTMVGNGDLIIENYKGIIEYDNDRIRVNSGIGIIKITGERLVIREITSEDILVSGEITSMEFIK